MGVGATEARSKGSLKHGGWVVDTALRISSKMLFADRPPRANGHGGVIPINIVRTFYVNVAILP
jgi:hypothetical protein